MIEFFAGAVLASGKMQTIKGGLHRLPEKLAEPLDVRLDSPVTAVRRPERGVEVQYIDTSGSSAVAQADACVIATLFKEAVQMYPPLADQGADLLGATKDAGCITVQLTYDGYTEKQPFLIMVPTAASSKIGTLFLEQAEATDSYPRGATLLSAFIALHSDSEAPTWSDDRLIGIVRELAERLFPELGGNFRAGRATRWQYASHQGEVGYYAALQKFLDNYPAGAPVQVAGDYLATSGQETAVTTGINAADKIIEAHRLL